MPKLFKGACTWFKMSHIVPSITRRKAFKQRKGTWSLFCFLTKSLFTDLLQSACSLTTVLKLAVTYNCVHLQMLMLFRFKFDKLTEVIPDYHLLRQVLKSHVMWRWSFLLLFLPDEHLIELLHSVNNNMYAAYCAFPKQEPWMFPNNRFCLLCWMTTAPGIMKSS